MHHDSQVDRGFVSGRRGLVTTGHALATEAGRETLLAGGNFVDAAIAAAAVLAVVRPSGCTIGGDCMILLDHHQQVCIGLNGSGACPQGLSADDFPARISTTGPRSATVPTLVRAWAALHERFGRLQWRDLFHRAIEAAEVGFPLSDDVANGISASHGVLARDPGCSAILLANGGVRAGETFRQPALAQTLRAIANDGADAFYEGDIARSISAYVAGRGGALTVADFAAASVEWVEPLRLGYHGVDVRVLPPNSYGLYLLLQLRLLDQAAPQWDDIDDAERLRTLIGAAQKAFAAGDRWVADPVVAPRSKQPDIEDVLTQGESGGSMKNPGGTSVVSVVDGEGSAIVVVQSVFGPWGGAVLDPTTGVLLNNRMNGFALERGHPNIIAPGKRPAHTLCPCLVFDEAGLRYLVSSPGGRGQTITLAQAITNLIDRRATLSDTVRMPRWSSDRAGAVILEDEFPDEILDALASAGIDAGRNINNGPNFGTLQLVERRPDGLLSCFPDHRREDVALAI